MHPDDRERTREIWNKAVATKSTYETEYRIRRRDGVYKYFLARGIPSLQEDGTIYEWVGVCIDITERKQAEDEIKKLNLELEKRVAERTAELEGKMDELETANRVMMGREDKILELKGEAAKLKEQPGQKA